MLHTQFREFVWFQVAQLSGTVPWNACQIYIAPLFILPQNTIENHLILWHLNICFKSQY
jgi:hypothetical protein